jgi:DUF1009 family protein
LIAGSGHLPRVLRDALHAQGQPFHLLAFKGTTDPQTPEGTSHLWASLGEIGRVLHFLKQNNVTHLVMAGKFERPSLSNLKVDWKGAAWLAQLAAHTQKSGLGDDALLQFLAQKLEGEGFVIRAPQDILHSLKAASGVLTTTSPSDEALKDIKLGFHVLHTLSPLDMGQAVVVQEGVILGVEGAEGTDALITRCGLLHKEGALGGVLVKGAKRQQDDRLDPPVIGPQTLLRAQEAGLSGIAFEAGRTLLLEEERLVALADQAGLFLVGDQAAPPRGLNTYP